MAAISLRGYCRTLIVFIACKPAMRMTKLTTIARTGRRIKRSVKDFISISDVDFASRIYRSWIQLRFRREIVVDYHRHSVPQLENTRANDCFTGFQTLGNRYEIAPSFAHAHNL